MSIFFLYFYKFLIIFLVIHFSDESDLKLLKKKEYLNSIRKLNTSSTPFTTIQTTIKDNNTNISTGNIEGNETTTDNLPNYIKKGKKRGLSAGGILAIILPCFAALIAVGIFAALCRTTPAPAFDNTPPIQNPTSSVERFGPVQEVVVQQQPFVKEIPVVKEVPVVQQQPVAVVNESNVSV